VYYSIHNHLPQPSSSPSTHLLFSIDTMASSQPTASGSTAGGPGVAAKVPKIPGLQVTLAAGTQPVRHIAFDIPQTVSRSRVPPDSPLSGC
jgi:hypothetical protein